MKAARRLGEERNPVGETAGDATDAPFPVGDDNQCRSPVAPPLPDKTGGVDNN